MRPERGEEAMKHPKFVQILSANDGQGFWSQLYALDENGEVWFYYRGDKEWRKLGELE